MAHQGKLIEQALVAQLIAAGTIAGARVHRDRVDPFKKGHLPAIALYIFDEETDLDASEGTAPRELTRQADVELQLFVGGQDAEDVSDAMWDFQEQIEASLTVDPYITSTAADSMLKRASREIFEGDGKSDPIIGVVTMVYTVTFQTSLVDAVLDDFITVHADTDLVGGVADTALTTDEYTVRPWTTDGTSGLGVPATKDEWAKLLDSVFVAERVPTYGWNFQDASGGAISAFGGIALAEQGAPTYQQSVTGWTRKAVKWADGNNDRFTAFAGIPNLNANSFAQLGYIFTSNTPAAEREIMGMGLATVSQVRATTAGVYKGLNASGGTATGAVLYGPSVRPVMYVYNRALSTLKIYTDAEIVTVPYAVISGGGVWFGGQTTQAPTGGVLFGAAWSGSVAEFVDDEVRDMLTALGWTVDW